MSDQKRLHPDLLGLLVSSVIALAGAAFLYDEVAKILGFLLGAMYYPALIGVVYFPLHWLYRKRRSGGESA